MTQANNIAPTTEIIGAMTTGLLDKSQIEALEKNPREFIGSAVGIEVADELAINFVNNDKEVVHLILPYYTAIEEMASAKLSDENLAKVQGGEILFVLLPTLIGASVGATVASSIFVASATAGFGVIAAGIAIGGGVGAAAGVTTAAVVGTSVAAGVQASKGKNINGSSK